MTIRVFSIYLAALVLMPCAMGYAAPDESSSESVSLRDSDLRLISVSPAVEQENAVLLEGPSSLSVIVSEDSHTVRIVAADGGLVTVPPEIVRLADVRAVVAPSGEAATVIDFEVPITLKATDTRDGHALYEITGALAVRRWGKILGGVDPVVELTRPRFTTVLGDAFRGIGGLLDLSVGIQIDEPTLSDEELIRRLSAEVVRLRSAQQTATAPAQNAKK